MKILFDKIWGYQNQEIFLKQGRRNLHFLTAHIKQMKFLE